MPEPINYFLDQATGTVDLTLTEARLTTKTKGKGLLDKLRIIDIPLSDLTHFCLVPTIAPQNLVSYASEGDLSYDSEFVFSYREGEQLKKKRVFVNSRDEAFKKLLENLKRECPSASLLHLEPAEAQKQIGVMASSRALYLIIGLLIGVPVLIALIVITSKVI